MFKIAICDDIKDELSMVKAYTEKYYASINAKIETHTYENMSDLLNSETEYDLFLLDVLMPGLTGIDGAALLQKRQKNPHIVFITSSIDAAVEGYRVNACGFLLKPVKYDSFKETMDRIHLKYLDNQNHTFTITYKKIEIEIDCLRILYIENKLHTIHIVLDNETVYSINEKLSDFHQNLTPPDQFIRCHQSYIVNLNAVKEIDSTGFILQNGDFVPVSRSNYKTCKAALYRYQLK